MPFWFIAIWYFIAILVPGHLVFYCNFGSLPFGIEMPFWFMAIWYFIAILVYMVYLVAVWYFCGHIGILFQVLVCCSKKNLATLLTRQVCRKQSKAVLSGSVWIRDLLSIG
jgi:hypothetical protein